MSNIDQSGTFPLGERTVKRLGYGVMQLAGPGVFGPPKDHAAALAVLREAVAHGVNHIDTSDFYGPHITNQIIREALHPYPDDLVIVTKIGAKRGKDGSWLPVIDDLARDGAAYVPFFPLGGFTPLQSSSLSEVAARLGATPMQVALAWLLRRAPNILLIPGTSSVAHMRENLAAAECVLADDAIKELDSMASVGSA